MSKIFQWVCPHCLQSVHRNIWIENFFFKIIVFSLVFGQWVKCFSSFIDNFLGALSRLQSSCHSEKFEEKQLFRENHNSYGFGNFGETISTLCRFIVSAVVKTAVQVCIETFWRKKLSSKRNTLLDRFRTLSKNISFCQKDFGAFVNTAF